MSFKMYAILSIMVKSSTILLHPTQAIYHFFFSHIHAV